MPRVYKRHWRCFNRIRKGSERKGDKGKKCWKRISSELHKLPTHCPSCKKLAHWADVTYDTERTASVKYCNDERCSYLYPHNMNSRECVHNPNRDPFDMTDELSVQSEEPPF